MKWVQNMAYLIIIITLIILQQYLKNISGTPCSLILTSYRGKMKSVHVVMGL